MDQNINKCGERVEHSPMAIVTLGQERTIVFRHRLTMKQNGWLRKINNSLPLVALTLQPGSILFINADAIKDWCFQIPRREQQAVTLILTFLELIMPSDD